MAMATKFVQYVARFSRASLSPAATLRRGLTAPLCHRFISSSGKDGEVAVKVDVENQRIGAGNFMNKTGPKPAEVGVGNGLAADVVMSPSTGTPSQTTMMAEESRPIYRAMQATTSTGPCLLDAILPIYTGLYRNPHSRMHAYVWKTMKVIGIAPEHVSKHNGGHPKEIAFTSGAIGSNAMSIKHGARLYKSHKYTIALQTEHKCVLDLCQHLQDEGYDTTYLPIKDNGLITLEHLEKDIRPNTALVSTMPVNNEIRVIQQMEEIGKLYQKQGVFFHTNGPLALGKIPVEVGKWSVDWMSISGTKVYGPKRSGTCYIRCGLKARIDPPTSGEGHDHGLRSGSLAHSLVIGLGVARRIATEGIEYTRAYEPPFSPNSICSGSSTVRDNYIHKIYHNKQPKQFTRTFQTMSYNKADTKKGKRNAKTKNSKVGIREANLTVPDNTEDQNTNVKRRTSKSTISSYPEMSSYSEMTICQAEKRLNTPLTLRGTPVKRMLEGKSVLLGEDTTLKLKRRIYQDLVDFLEARRYPIGANLDLKERNIQDIVGCTIYPMVAQVKRETKRDLHLSREAEITAKDSSTGGMAEFVVTDNISLQQTKYVLVVEAKKVSLKEARKQCFLSLKDMRDCNGGGTVYGFITTGDSWRMITFDGEFKTSEKIYLLLDTMDEKEELWMAKHSILIDCFNVALSHGGRDHDDIV